MIPAVYGWLGLALALIGFIVWLRWAIRRGASAEAQAEKETRARLASEKARAKELEIRDAVQKVRDSPSPRIPTLDELRPPPGGPGPPA